MQDRELPALKADFPFFKEVPSQVLQQTLENLDKAYQMFFKGVGDYPIYKKKFKNEPGLRFPQGVRLLEHNNPKKGLIQLPKIGKLKFFKSREILGKIKSATIVKEADGYYISFLTDYDEISRVKNGKHALGIDLGVKISIATSDSVAFNLDIKKIKLLEKKKKVLQRKLAEKTVKSNNWSKLLKKINRLDRRITYIRNDFHWKTAREIAKNHGLIAVEDLKIKNMSKSAKGTLDEPGKNVAAKSGLNKAILDQAWGRFTLKLEWMAKKFGSEVVYVNPKFSSQTCSKCEHKDGKNRQSRNVFACRACGHSENADFNAAKNLLARGLRVNALKAACG